MKKAKRHPLMWGITRNGELRQTAYKSRAVARRVSAWLTGYSKDGAKYKAVRIELREVRCR